jgi:hypothetical protein
MLRATNWCWDPGDAGRGWLSGTTRVAAVQIKDALPFHECLGSKVVIADTESLDAN